MEHSSSRRDLRAERLGRSSPYARPDTKSKKSTSSAPFATIKSIYSYFASPFARPDTGSSLPLHVVDIEQKSESGSEDGWNGDSPTLMDGQDVFDLAAAAGRDGREFDDRAAEWRAKGEKVGGRRDMVRRNLEGTALTAALKSPSMPGHLKGMKASPSLPALTIANTNRLKRNLPSPRLPSRSHLPSFLPPSSHPEPPTPSVVTESASSAALATFLEAKKGQQMTVEDFRVIDTLTANMKSESVAGSPKGSDPKTGGWSAGTFSATPRAKPPLSGANGFDSLSSTPASPSTIFAMPGVAFSLGNTPLASSSTSPRRITYLGPGMSPRRIFPKSRSGIKPLFDLDMLENEAAQKKRKLEEGALTVRAQPSDPLALSNGLSHSVSMPSFGNSNEMRSSFVDKSNGLGLRSTGLPSRDATTSRQDAVSIGMKRASDIMKELIDEELSSVEESRPRDYLVINPYDTDSSTTLVDPPRTTPRSPVRSGTPRKSILRSSLRAKETPKRGAAAKLDAHRSGRKLTTMEILQGKRPWTETSAVITKESETPSKTVRMEPPSKEDDEMEIDAYFDETPSRTPVSPPLSSAPTTRAPSSRIPSLEPIPPFAVPQLNVHTQPIPNSKHTSNFSQPFASPTQDSALASAQKKAQPKFIPSPLSTSITTVDMDEPETNRDRSATRMRKPPDINAVYLSATESALKIAKPALPFFTFNISLNSPIPSNAIRIEALRRPIENFAFSLSAIAAAPAPSGAKVAPVKPPSSQLSAFGPIEVPTKAGPVTDGEWTCSLCMLRNPGSAKEECMICGQERS